MYTCPPRIIAMHGLQCSGADLSLNRRMVIVVFKPEEALSQEGLMLHGPLMIMTSGTHFMKKYV